LNPLYVTAYTLASALGHGCQATHDALARGVSGLRRNDFQDCALDTCIGRVEGVEAQALPPGFAAYDSRSARLAELGLGLDGFSERVARARARHGGERIGVFIGTSSSGILEAELAYRRRGSGTGTLPPDIAFRETYNLCSISSFVQQRLGCGGPAYTVSSACSSSAKAFASAARALATGLCDAAVAGGVETLCFTTLHGFNSLELLSREPCRPCDEARNGISIGEAAAFALLEKEDAAGEGFALIGYGESSDAWHMSTPHPEGEGAIRAMRAALASARLSAAAIDYVNLHGTGTRSNDAAEDAAVFAVVGDAVPCSATKGFTGHTLGAAGAVEALITLLALRHRFVPGTANCEQVDPGFRSKVLLEGASCPVSRAMSNSFGFGGSNCSLIFGRT
jgi:3-oxoacyl-[acyl-carrier-protein] synthase-1